LGVSGGTDSSYLLHLLTQEFGLRVLAVHYDNTWNSAIATTNIGRMIEYTQTPLYTYVVNNHEIDDIFRAFFFAGVAEIEASTDLGYAYLLRKVAAEFQIRFIIEGHSFTQEGITPLSNNYFDGQYIRDIHKKYGSMSINSYPLMTLRRFIASAMLHPVSFIRPLWYLNYSKRDARQLLTSNYSWQYYGGHHLENRMTAFYHTVYLPRKFNADMRINSVSALVRSGELTRAEGLAVLSEPVQSEPGLIEYFCNRLRIDAAEFDRIMNEKPRSWTEFRTYKRWFEVLEPMFRILAAKGRVPMSFYIKYCREKH
jgi:hypothetical protein